MKCITFQKPNIYYLFFLGYFISIFSRDYINDLLFNHSKYKSVYLYRMYVYILSHLLSFIPYLISNNFHSKKREKAQRNNSNDTIYIYNDQIKNYQGLYLFKQILIVSLFGFFSEAVLYVFYLINNNEKSVTSYNLGIYLIINTVLIYLASYFVLKTYFYRHHYLSLFINSICFLITLVIDIIIIKNAKIKEVNYYIYNLIKIIRLILLCFLFCFSKKILNSAFLYPYSIIALRSIYETIFLVIFTIPLIFVPIKEFNNEEDIIFKSFLNFLKGINILYSILLLILDYLLDLFTMFIIHEFSPSHLTLAMTLKSFATLVYNIIKNNILKKNVYWSQYTSLGINLVLFIGSMIHNEIFIINCCELNKKTKLYLDNEFIGEISKVEDTSSISNDNSSNDKREMVLLLD